MRREKFQTRTITLWTEVQRTSLLALAGNLPCDADHPLEVVVREKVKVRGLDQNGLYWKRLGEIAEQGWFNGRRFNSDAWHYYAKLHLMPEEITTKDGEVRPKWEETPGGEVEVISTTRLEKGCFAEYTNIVEAFGASLGVMFSTRSDSRHA